MERHIKGARRRVGGVFERIRVDGGRRGTGTGQRREQGAIAESIFANLANRVGEVYGGETLTVPERAITITVLPAAEAFSAFMVLTMRP